MAEIDTSSGGGKHKGKKRGKKHSTRIDMTPMVDLAFLLVTFFMFATTLAKPSAMQVTMPDDTPIPDKEKSEVVESKALTVILGKGDNIYYFRGFFGSKKGDPEISKTSFGETNIRKVLLEKKDEITRDFVPNVKDQRPVILIKPSRASKYKNLVDILDEMSITELKRFVVVDIAPDDLDHVRKAGFDE
jgi:biopolymer transport protein ExbD